jgi:F-type H+-transporting ATPase subunit delta
MRDRKLASRYARALKASLPDIAMALRVDEFLGAMRQHLLESEGFQRLLYDPAVPRPTRKQVLRSLAERAEMPERVANLLDAVVDHNRTTSLPSIAELFHEEVEAAQGIVPAEIATAAPLDDELRQRATQALERLTGKTVRLTTTVEPDLLGGAVTRIGSMVFDGSVRTQLAQLRRRMVQE